MPSQAGAGLQIIRSTECQDITPEAHDDLSIQPRHSLRDPGAVNLEKGARYLIVR